MAQATRFTVGCELRCCPDIRLALNGARAEGFDFVAAPLVHPRLRRDARGVSDARDAPLTRSDLLLSSGEWSRLVVGVVSSWAVAEVDDELSYDLRRGAEAALHQELEWASHLSLSAVVVPLMMTTDGGRPLQTNLARLLNAALQSVTSWQVWVRCDMGAGWAAWDGLRRLCSHSIALAVALELTAALPEAHVARRWRGEPIKVIFIPCAAFVPNDAGFPVLPRAFQDLLVSLATFEPRLLVTGRPRHARGRAVYVQYLQHVAKTKVADLDVAAQIEKPYRDYLQAPLQPLGDNLESSTYETFERDPVKYAQYELAVRSFLQDHPPPPPPPVAPEKEESTSDDDLSGNNINANNNNKNDNDIKNNKNVVVVMVVGAGRGPLVDCVLRAAQAERRSVKVYAVEKNANAVVTLRARRRSEAAWMEAVTVVACDMREFAPAEEADLLVSELLGSFGDNELSPECLDGAQRFLKKDTGVSIPQRYESFAQPVACARLWAEARRQPSAPHLPSAQSLSPGAPPPPIGLETPFVVKLHNFSPLAEPQPCFAFYHPTAQGHLVDNTRHATLRFPIAVEASVHGLAGYFETQLYGDVTLSINPPTFSDGMFSWFPLFIPFVQPLTFDPSSDHDHGNNSNKSNKKTLDVDIWRREDSRRVWYEWAVTAPEILPIHNPYGRASAINK